MLSRTTTQLLDDLVDPANEQVWRDFDDRFRPILIAFGRRLGLSAEDAADAAQEALTRFVTAYRKGQYDRSRGRLRSWLTGIARNCIADLRRDRAVHRAQGGLSAVAAAADTDDLESIWDAECEREIIRRAVEQLEHDTKVDARTIDAFKLIAFEERRPADVAEALGMTPNDVYLAKHRCLKRLRGIVEQLKEVYEFEV